MYQLGDQQLLRYSRQILLPQFDYTGQEKISQSSVLIVGSGGLGCPASLYLTAAGVGKIILADPDTVELSNLQRQINFSTADINRPKVEAAGERLAAINPDVELELLQEKLDSDRLLELAKQVDLVVDCSDSFATRFAVNRACVEAKKPLVSAAAIGFEGQFSVFDSTKENCPCYACLYPEADFKDQKMSCSDSGVISPLLGIMGSKQALETIKYLADIGKSPLGKLWIFDGTECEWRSLQMSRDSECEVCGDCG
ncbi:HesA/MoeB/ThiF family protein [Pelagibaculum spongiae]|uniref:Molybdopterin-synthase adenylyltransferase n=1 Tax=Pelagibaculum spongiae TaxID=2080658 RepID=A0A2V1H1W1_9GAMM|nr:HesA/MoeB/ThiF family protein [Pelagibaculum spongiae]PVZ72523.1 molybdopterin-synthase adenylyltransferase MoeB [Pelagibaculum spongiae]